jgi:hypothetical protein
MEMKIQCKPEDMSTVLISFADAFIYLGSNIQGYVRPAASGMIRRCTKQECKPC